MTPKEKATDIYYRTKDMIAELMEVLKMYIKIK